MVSGFVLITRLIEIFQKLSEFLQEEQDFQNEDFPKFLSGRTNFPKRISSGVFGQLYVEIFLKNLRINQELSDGQGGLDMIEIF